MMTRCLNRFARPAMLWLLVAMFAMPTALVRFCPCIARGGDSPCSCDVGDTETATAKGLGCCHKGRSSASGKTVTADLGGLGFLVCHCSDHCPCACQCEGHDQQATPDDRCIILRPSAERSFDVAAGFSCTPRLRFRISRFDRSQTVGVATAQQRCVTLSRFLI